MDRQAYNSCMSPFIRGTGKSKEDRQMDFCIGAKICTGKAKDEKEARLICEQPKAPKPEKTGKRRSKKSAECPPFDTMSLMPKCEKQLGKMVQSGELPSGFDVVGACELILG